MKTNTTSSCDKGTGQLRGSTFSRRRKKEDSRLDHRTRREYRLHTRIALSETCQLLPGPYLSDGTIPNATSDHQTHLIVHEPIPLPANQQHKHTNPHLAPTNPLVYPTHCQILYPYNPKPYPQDSLSKYLTTPKLPTAGASILTKHLEISVDPSRPPCQQQQQLWLLAVPAAAAPAAGPHWPRTTTATGRPAA